MARDRLRMALFTVTLTLTRAFILTLGKVSLPIAIDGRGSRIRLDSISTSHASSLSLQLSRITRLSMLTLLDLPRCVGAAVPPLAPQSPSLSPSPPTPYPISHPGAPGSTSVTLTRLLGRHFAEFIVLRRRMVETRREMAAWRAPSANGRRERLC